MIGRSSEAVTRGEHGGWGWVCDLGKDSEIKRPGPFWSKALMVLENFRDHALGDGPGVLGFLSVFNGLSGAFRAGRPDV